jgi:endoglucanase
MLKNTLTRRGFFGTALASTAVVIAAKNLISTARENKSVQNVIPRWRGFNLLDFFTPYPPSLDESYATTEDDFRWMRDWGFDFVRIPMAYPRYIKWDRSEPIKPSDLYNMDESALETVDKLVAIAHRYGLHVSLNLHRAPGYCVNAGFQEPFDLWNDQQALDAFCFHWAMWAKRYKNIPSSKISFDLVNEPSVRQDMNDQHSKRIAVPGTVYRRVVEAAAKAIRAANPDHLIIADGNDVGSRVIPEIMDLGVVQSCRGYYPAIISHYKAPWVYKTAEGLPAPVWPGKIDGEDWGRARLEQYYAPWIELTKKGIGVHCGECGCWRMTPHQVFLSWFGDVLDILTENNIGYATWNFRGDFGILDSGRTDVEYENWYGHTLDRKMLDLMLRH